jgi:hypothetical protein
MRAQPSIGLQRPGDRVCLSTEHGARSGMPRAGHIRAMVAVILAMTLPAIVIIRSNQLIYLQNSRNSCSHAKLAR